MLKNVHKAPTRVIPMRGALRKLEVLRANATQDFLGMGSNAQVCNWCCTKKKLFLISLFSSAALILTLAFKYFYVFGTRLVRFVSDVDECADVSLNTCDVNARCSNNPGSFSCTCKSGYQSDGISCTCENVS